MSRVPLGAAVRGDFGRPTPPSYREHYELTSQFEGAERIADKWGITRADCDQFGLESQQRAQRAWAEGRFEREVVADRRARRRRGRQADRHDAPRRTRRRPARDVARGARQAEAGRARERRAHRGLVVADHRRRRRGARRRPRAGPASSGCSRGPASSTSASSASIRCSCSPARSTRPAASSSAPASRSTTSTSIEINEAFASVVLAWEREVKPDMAQVNPNGGAIALGHPVGATGARLDHHRAARARAHRRHASRSSRCAAAAGSARARSSSACSEPFLVAVERPDGLLEGEELVAQLAVRFSPGAPTNLDDHATPSMFRPSVVQRHTFARLGAAFGRSRFPGRADPRWCSASRGAPARMCGRPSFASRPRRSAGAVPLYPIHSRRRAPRFVAVGPDTAVRARTIVGSETMRGAAVTPSSRPSIPSLQPITNPDSLPRGAHPRRTRSGTRPTPSC